MPAERKTAFIIIHGVGSHTPFQACDSFVRGFYDVLKKKEEYRGKDIPVEHKMKQRKDWSGKDIPWVQNYISMSLPDRNEVIDFYEYFWDIYMVHEARFSEAYKMLSTASKGAKRFYKRLNVVKSDLGKYGRKTKLGFGEVEFRPTGYFRLLGPIFTFLSVVLPYLPGALKILDKWAGTQFPVIKQMFGGFSLLMKEPVPDFLGDMVRYLDLDPRSEHHETRRRIMNGALDELRELMTGGRYDRIIVAGHSLGSVIAYDTLNRVVQETNVVQMDQARRISRREADKIAGLITFGSPLDKIAFFFRERVEEHKKVQRQVLSNLHGFKTLSLPEDKAGINIGNPMTFKMENTRWLNFYHPEDLISGKLDYYDLKDQSFEHLNSRDGNIELKEHFSKLRAHSCYWGAHLGEKKGTNEMYEAVIKEFFQLR
ncbi:MAG: hypothetical protein ACXABY_15495 [Candidatus Thorarchaeota archaeon]|jgi:hypothetical protein